MTFTESTSNIIASGSIGLLPHIINTDNFSIFFLHPTSVYLCYGMADFSYLSPSNRARVERTIQRIRNDPCSVMDRVYTPSSLIYTTQKDSLSRLSYGTWIDPRTGRVAVARLVGPLAYGLTSYMDMNGSPGLSVIFSITYKINLLTQTIRSRMFACNLQSGDLCYCLL